MTFEDPHGGTKGIDTTINYAWRAPLTDPELDALHSAAFGYSAAGVPWNRCLERRSIGWVTARRGEDLVGFANVIGDGGAHTVLLDVAVDLAVRGTGVGTALVRAACAGARELGYTWMHVDYEARLEPFYTGACGFGGTEAGLLRLSGPGGTTEGPPTPNE